MAMWARTSRMHWLYRASAAICSISRNYKKPFRQEVMTMNISMTKTTHPGKLPPADRLGFGSVFTDHMFLMNYTDSVNS